MHWVFMVCHLMNIRKKMLFVKVPRIFRRISLYLHFISNKKMCLILLLRRKIIVQTFHHERMVMLGSVVPTTNPLLFDHLMGKIKGPLPKFLILHLWRV